MSSQANTEGWTHTIEPASGWFDVRLSDIWRYRDLIGLFIQRDFITIYKQTLLGPLWFLLQPLFSMVIFTIVFAEIAHIPTDGIPAPLFYLTGIVAWNYFASCLNKTADTLAGNATVFGKVWFPRLTLPISIVLSNVLVFLIQFLLFIGIYLYYKWNGASFFPATRILLVPVLILQMAALGLGFGIIVSALITRFRDLVQVVTFGVQLWMFLTPVVYPATAIPDRWRWIVTINPMAPIVEIFRSIFFGGSFPAEAWMVSLTETVLVLLLGIILFSRVEKSFLDNV